MGDKRKISPASAQLSECFTTQQIYQYHFDTISTEKRIQIFNHLNVLKCQRCINIYRLVNQSDKTDIPLLELSDDVKSSIVEKMKKKRKNFVFPSTIPLKIESGQIWTISQIKTRPDDEAVLNQEMGVPVLIVSPGNKTRESDNYIQVFPLSFDTEFEMEDESCLVNIMDGFSLLCELFNQISIPASNLCDYKWSVTVTEFEKILNTHKNHISKGSQIRDHQYELWKQKEIEIGQLFSIPRKHTDAQILLGRIKKAAESSDIELKDYQFYPLVEKKNWSLTMVQKRDVLFLQLAVAKPISHILRINNQLRQMIEKTKGDFEIKLFDVADSPESVDISIVIQGQELIFRSHFQKTMSL